MGKAMFAAVGIILAELYTGKVGYGFVVYPGLLWFRGERFLLLYPTLSVISSNVTLIVAHGLVV